MSAVLMCGLAGWYAVKTAKRVLHRRHKHAAGATCDNGSTIKEGLAKPRSPVYRIEAVASTGPVALPYSQPAGAAAPKESGLEALKEAPPSDPAPAAPHVPVPASQAGAPCSTKSGNSSTKTDSSSPIRLRYGAAAGQGVRPSMEDAHIMWPSFADGHSSSATNSGTRAAPGCLKNAFFGVFDGHNGSAAAEFGREHLAQALLASEHFPHDLPAAMRHAFLHTDEAFYRAVAAGAPNPSSQQQPYADDAAAAAVESSGATALTAVLWGGRLVVGNAGDCRAVLSRRGKALDLSRDHKPGCDAERRRIEAAGGFVCPDGRLGGQLSVARAIGDYGVRAAGPSGCGGDGPGDRPGGAWLKRPSDEPGPFRFVGPLTAEPEVAVHELAPEDEFVVLACDGLWDVLGSQRAVELARHHLRAHNDPARTAQHLVDTAFGMHSSDNVTCLVVCFSEAPPPPRFQSTRPRYRFSALSGPGLASPSTAPSSTSDSAAKPLAVAAVKPLVAAAAEPLGTAAAKPLGAPAAATPMGDPAPSGQASLGASPLLPQHEKATLSVAAPGGLGMVAEE